MTTRYQAYYVNKRVIPTDSRQ